MAVPGVRRVRSKSIRGASEISAQFDPSTDMVVALQMLQNRVAEITGDLPIGTQAPDRADDPGDLSGVHPEHHRHAANRRPVRLRATS